MTLSFSNGTQHYYVTDAQGVATFPQSPGVPYVATLDYLGVSYQVPGNGATGDSANVTLVLSYPLLYAGMAFVVLLSGVAVARKYAHKKRAISEDW